MRLYGGGVDQHLLGRTICAGQGMEKIAPHALRRPADIAVVERFLRSVFGRCVHPAPAGFQDMDDTADHALIINPRLAPCITGQMRHNPLKLRLCQPELIPIHHDFLPETVNHKPAPVPTILWVWTLISRPLEVDDISKFMGDFKSEYDSAVINYDMD